MFPEAIKPTFITRTLQKSTRDYQHSAEAFTAARYKCHNGGKTALNVAVLEVRFLGLSVTKISFHQCFPVQRKNHATDHW